MTRLTKVPCKRPKVVVNQVASDAHVTVTTDHGDWTGVLAFDVCKER